ncbi:hypothetical protein AvCA_38290 [Azotobacter vinelandii CA]|uniref:Uncharacterized protein n=2 Tax=Azotobacter vinelandii TaxID=354 RepID=C1DSM8_AZOVD|nr:hypothetical protein Avin_38290 [Azotobacter vinelandii DJ]AGK16151.1 hypothetical protein AvCA_38290 [Azotobacter vinelandii CA]AGK21629.1 hypothetical protein AvCA6_38290 [Azotobacter vinelandii CA6]
MRFFNPQQRGDIPRLSARAVQSGGCAKCRGRLSGDFPFVRGLLKFFGAVARMVPSRVLELFPSCVHFGW